MQSDGWGEEAKVEVTKSPDAGCVERVSIRVMMFGSVSKQRTNIFVHQEDVPWLVRYACMEFSMASGTDLGIEAETQCQKQEGPRLAYRLTGSTGVWECMWADSETGLEQRVSRTVPHRKMESGGILSLTPTEFLLKKMK